MISFQKFYRVNESSKQLGDYDLIPIESVKRAEDVKEMWLVYQLDSEEQKNQLKDFLENHSEEIAKAQTNKTWDFKLKTQDLGENTLAVIGYDLDLTEPVLLKMDFIEILGAYSSRLRSSMHDISNSIGRQFSAGKDTKKYNTLSWVSFFRPKLIGIKTKYKEMEKELPELKGIFESEEDKDVVDIKVEVNPEDKFGNETTPEIIDAIAYELIRYTKNRMSRDVDEKGIYTYEYELKPNGFVILDVPTKVAEAYANKLYGVVANLDAWLDGGEYYLDLFAIGDIDIDEKSAKIRRMTGELPELKGIFESKQEKDKLILTFDPTYGTTDHDRVRLALKSFKVKMSYLTRYLMPDSISSCKIIRYNKGFKFAISIERENSSEPLSEEKKNALARLIQTQWNGTKKDFEIRESIDYTAKWISRYDKMLKDLPELQGIFESKTNQPDSIIAKFTNLDKTNKELLWKFLEEKKRTTFRYTLYDKGPREVHAIIQLMNPDFYTQTGKVTMLKRSLEQMFVHDARRVAPDMEWEDVVNKRLPEIFKNCEMKLINKGLHDLQQQLPELEGIFESEEPETVLVTRYKGYARQKEDLHKILKSVANAFEKTSIETVEEENGKIVMELVVDLTESFLKESPNVQKELRPWRHHWETTIYNDYYDSLRDLKRREKITGEYISVMPEFVWKTRHYFLSNELPELKGIFESEETTDDKNYVDVAIEVKPTDSKGTKTSPEILKIIATELNRVAANAMEENWDTKSYKLSYEWEILHDPLRIVFCDVPLKIYETYMTELKEAAFFLDRYLGSKLGEDYDYRINSLIFGKLYVDREGKKLRKLKKNLPELEGIF
jgi:hemoglobin-like flavoprotein